MINSILAKRGLWFGFFFLLLIVKSFHNFLLFHLSVELFSIVIAFIMFALVLNLFDKIESDYFIFLGLIYGFIGGLDLLHTISYQGMGVFPDHTANLPTQLWIIARYVESISLLISFYFLNHKINVFKVTYTYIGIITLLLLSVFWWGVFPDCYLSGIGLTNFKVMSEYIVILFLAVALGVLIYYKQRFEKKMYFYMFLSILFTIISELFFTFYVSVYGLSNIIGHFAKVISFYLIYKSVVEVGLRKPYNTIFNRIVQTKDKLAQKNNELEQIISVISHDLRSPLANISGFGKEIEFSLNELQAELDDSNLRSNKKERIDVILEEDLSEAVDYILTSSNNMSKMLSGLLKVSRINNSSLTREDVNIKKLIETIITDYKYKIETNNIKLEIDEMPNCVADQLLIKQVFSNLIDNAIKYSKQENQAKVIIAGKKKEKEVVYSIQDNGVGISDEDQKKIFNIFEQLNNSKQGEGLGLALVKKIISLHQGQIWVESTVGVGTTIFFTLPAS